MMITKGKEMQMKECNAKGLRYRSLRSINYDSNYDQEKL